MAKSKTLSKRRKRIPKIKPEVELGLTEERDLNWYRDQLDPVRQFLWDKCMEGLSENKAMGKWPDLMKKIEELVGFIEITNADTELTLDFDVVATREVIAS